MDFDSSSQSDAPHIRSYLGVSHCNRQLSALALVSAPAGSPEHFDIPPNQSSGILLEFGPPTSVSPEQLEPAMLLCIPKISQVGFGQLSLFNHQVSRKASKSTDLQLLWS